MKTREKKFSLTCTVTLFKRLANPTVSLDDSQVSRKTIDVCCARVFLLEGKTAGAIGIAVDRTGLIEAATTSIESFFNKTGHLASLRCEKQSWENIDICGRALWTKVCG